MTEETNTTELVRAYSLTRGMLTKKEACLDLGLSTDSVKYAFNVLVEQGYLRKVKHGLYQFVARVEKPVQEKTDKIWRAMSTMRLFTAPEVAKLADTTTSYVYKLIHGFRDDGYIRQAGRKRSVKGGTEQAWRLTPAGKAKASSPQTEEYKPDPVVEAAMTLNYLVGTRVALRSGWAAGKAMELLDQIRKGLEDVAAS